MHEVKVQIKKLEKLQYCFCWEKHFYKIYKTYNHEFSIESPFNIYSYDLLYNLPTDEMLSNFPYFFVTSLTLKFFFLFFQILHEKNYRFIMTIYCDFVEYYLQNESKKI